MEGLAAKGLSHADLEAEEDAEEEADEQGVQAKSKKKKKKSKPEPEATAAADVLTNGEAPATGIDSIAAWSDQNEVLIEPESLSCGD